MGRWWAALAGFIVRWRLWLVAATLVAAGVAATGLPRIELDTHQDTLVPADSQLFRDNVRYQDAFGGGEIVVLFTGDPLVLLQGENLQRLEDLQAKVGQSRYVARSVSP